MNPVEQIGFISGAPGPGELIVIFLVVLLLFGPRRLPSLARTLGRIMQQLRRASHDFHDQLMRVEDETDAYTPEDAADDAPGQDRPDILSDDYDDVALTDDAGEEGDRRVD